MLPQSAVLDMRRRNFLSGLMAAPLAVKARLAQFFARKGLPVERCDAEIFGAFVIDDSHTRQSCVDRQHNNDFMTALVSGESDPDRLRAGMVTVHRFMKSR